MLRRRDPSETGAAPTWRGAEALYPFLVAIGDLEPFEGNPRRGDIGTIQRSLRRFGQVRPVAIDGDGRTIVAGHHVVMAASEEGWSHVAAVPNAFANESEARAYLLADNRIHDVGSGYDTALLAAQLQALVEQPGGLEGTGYTNDDLDSYLAQLAEDPGPVLPPAGDSQRDPSDTVEVVLVFSREQRDQFEAWAKIVARERGTHGVSETVYEGMRHAAQTLNQDA